MRDDQATVALDAWGYDAMLMRERVSWSRLFDRADLEKGVDAGLDGFDAPVYCRLDGVSFGSRGIALFVIVELQRALARHRAPVKLSSG
jgi:hypothetical protein